MITKNQVVNDLIQTGVAVNESGIEVTLQFKDMSCLGNTLMGLACTSERLATQLLNGEESQLTAISMLTVAELMTQLIKPEHYAIIDSHLLAR